MKTAQLLQDVSVVAGANREQDWPPAGIRCAALAEASQEPARVKGTWAQASV